MNSPLTTMDLQQLQNNFADLMQQMFNDEFLNEQFKVVQSLQVDSPGFLSSIKSTYFNDSEKGLSDMNMLLDEQDVNFQELREKLIEFKGATSSMGFQRVYGACLALIECCGEHNQQGCLQALKQLQEEHSLLKSKIEPLFMLEKQIVDAGGSDPFLIKKI